APGKERNPRSPACHVEHRIEDRPVGDSVGPVTHSLGLAERRRYAPGVEMIATDGDWRRYFTRGDKVVDRHAELRAIGLAEPADPRRKSLEFYLLLRERDPPAKMLVVRK